MNPIIRTFALSFFCALAAPAFALIHLEADGSGDYPTIQAALNAAAAGEIIELADGVYTGSGNTNLQFFTDLTLRSQFGQQDCIIDCQGSARAFSLVEESGGSIEGITVRNGWADQGGAIRTAWGDYEFMNCLFMDNHAAIEGGAWYGDDLGTITFSNCEFVDNTAGARGGALSGIDVTLTVDACSLVRNGSPNGGAIYAGSGAAVMTSNSLIAWSRQGGAFKGYYYASATFECSDLYGNTDGDWTGGATGLGTDGNISADPLLADPMAAEPDLSLTPGSPCHAFANTCGQIGARSTGSSSEAIYGVAPDGSGMFATIQDALSALPDGRVIVLEDGHYAGNGNVALTPAGKSMTIRSRHGDPENCLIDLTKNPGESAFVFTGGETGFRVEGIAIQNGLLSLGSLFDIGAGTDLTFANCLIRSNRVSDTAYLLRRDGGGHLAFESCEIRENATYSDLPLIEIAGDTGAAVNSLALTDTELRANEATGTGWILSATDSDVDVEGGALVFNTVDAGKILYLDGCAVQIDGVQSMSNTSGSRVIHLRRCTGEVLDGVFRGNTGGSGPGLAIESSDVSVRNCRFELNESAGFGGGAYVWANEGVTLNWVHFEYCEFLFNRAVYNGGGLYAIANGTDLLNPTLRQVLHVRVDHCTFYRNQAGDPGGWEQDSAAQVCAEESFPYGTGDLHMSLDYSLIAAGDSCQGFHRDRTDVTINACNINGNDGGDWVGAWAQQQLAYEENICEFPGFCDPTDGDLSLNVASPCLPDNNIAAVQMGANGAGCAGLTPVEEIPTPAARTRITGSAPNPFNPSTTLRYELASPATVTIGIHDAAGRLVRVLVAAEAQPAGPRQARWDGRDDTGRTVGAGVYFARLTAGAEASTLKMLLLK